MPISYICIGFERLHYFPIGCQNCEPKPKYNTYTYIYVYKHAYVALSMPRFIIVYWRLPARLRHPRVVLVHQTHNLFWSLQKSFCFCTCLQTISFFLLVRHGRPPWSSQPNRFQWLRLQYTALQWNTYIYIYRLNYTYIKVLLFNSWKVK